MVNTEDYIIPCERVFDEKLTDDLVENKEKLASDFLTDSSRSLPLL